MKKLETNKHYVSAAKIVTIAGVVLCNMALTFGSSQIGTAIDTGAGEILAEIESVYCGSLFFLLLAVNLLTLVLTKNEKVMGVAKKTLIGIVAAYIIIKALSSGSNGVIGNTMETINGWFNGGQ